MKISLKINDSEILSSTSKKIIIDKLIASINYFVDNGFYCDSNILNQTKSFVDKQKLKHILFKDEFNAKFYLSNNKNSVQIQVE